MNTSNIDFIKKGKTRLAELMMKQIIEEEKKKKLKKEYLDYIKRKRK